MGKDEVTFIIKTPEWTMNVSLNPNEGGDNAKEERAKRLMSILEKFSTLPPDIQEKILEFTDSLEIPEDKMDGQNPKN